MQPSTKKVEVKYFAVLKEQRGISSESHETAALTAGELFAELAERHQFSLPAEQLAVAVNHEFRTWDTALKTGDIVAFIPPVAGG